MPKPIPVFVFAFAAYAATSERFLPGAASERSESEGGLALFPQIFRTMSSKSERSLLVKVALRAPGAAVPSRAEAYWLTNIVETARGYQGRVVVAPARRRVRKGQQLQFEAQEVVGWSVRDGARHRQPTPGRPADNARHAGPEKA